jgi:predicted glycosyltransferase
MSAKRLTKPRRMIKRIAERRVPLVEAFPFPGVFDPVGPLMVDKDKPAGDVRQEGLPQRFLLTACVRRTSNCPMRTIWVDLDNAPHVPFFKPLILGLQDRGHRVLVTVRDHGYTRDLMDETGIPYDLVGHHAGKSIVRKVTGTLWRVACLQKWARGKGIDVGVSHGSRALVLACAAMRKPCVTMYDYEFVSTSVFNRLSSKVLLPDILPKDLLASLGVGSERLAQYPGMKEEVYLGDFTPDPLILVPLGVTSKDVLAVIRPPATTAHYHNPLSEEITRALYDKVSESENVVGVIPPRTAAQAAAIRPLLKNPINFRILEKPVNGLNLIAHADLVVGGGGTMNREAALLGVPVYSVFTGRVGTIDRALAAQGRLTLVRTLEDVSRVKFIKRVAPDYAREAVERKKRSAQLVEIICSEIVKTAR